jgi:hypothetical protein
MKHPSFPSRHRRLRLGSALVTVILFTTVMSLLMVSIVSWSTTEKSLNARTVYFIEARNAAEALCEYGAAQINYIAQNKAPAPSFDPQATTIDDTHNPLQLPFTADTLSAKIPLSFFNPNATSNGIPNYGSTGADVESHIDTNPISTTNPSGLELIGGKAVKIPTTGSAYYVDPTVLENEDDPFATFNVRRTDYQVLAKATVVRPDGQAPISAFVKQTVSVRGVPLFNWFIFYSSSDLEVYPGATMVCTGPVHTNYNMFINASNSATLTFKGKVTVSGDIYHSMEYPSADDKQTAMDNNSIYFNGAKPPLPYAATAMNPGGGSTWYDSTDGHESNTYSMNKCSTSLSDLANSNLTGFNKDAKAMWNGNLQTRTPQFFPPGFSSPLIAGTGVDGLQYKADTPYVDNGDQVAVANGSNPGIKIDHHYSCNYHGVTSSSGTPTLTPFAGNVSAFNDPPDSDFNSTNYPTKDTYYNARNGLEAIKYANAANLYILVAVDTTTTPYQATINYYGPYNSSNIGKKDPSGNYYGPNGGIYLGTAYLNSTTPYIPLPASGWTAGPMEPPNLVSFVPYVPSGTKVKYGFYDQRQHAAVDIVRVNMSALNQALIDVNTGTGAPGSSTPANPPTAILNNSVDSNNKNLNGVPNTNGKNSTIWGSGTMIPSNGLPITNDNTGGWNGTVYIDVEADSGTVNANNHEICVCLDNGKTQTTTTGSVTKINAQQNLIPNALDPSGNPLGNKPDSIVGAAGLPGLSLATNAPVYIVGNFNADGKLTTGGSALPDDETTDNPWTTVSQEVPVAIIADAVTLLSPNYFSGTDSSINTDDINHPPGDVDYCNNATDTENAYSSQSTPDITANGSSEVACAIVAGLVLSTDSAASGGVNNLPRFIEKWNSGPKKQVYRGSLVNLYVSKIATSPFVSGSVYFDPPNRIWGYADIFADGIFPPYTPYSYGVRRLYFNDLSASDYTNARIDATYGWPSEPTPFVPVQ